MKLTDVRELLSQLLWLKDEIEAGRASSQAVTAYAELCARVELATDNMETADSDAEAAVHWSQAAEEIRDFISLHPRPTRH